MSLFNWSFAAFVAMCCVSISGCVMMSHSSADYEVVDIALKSKGDVLTKYGKPKQVKSEGNLEIWEYLLKDKGLKEIEDQGWGAGNRPPVIETKDITIIMGATNVSTSTYSENTRFYFEGDRLVRAMERANKSGGFGCGVFIGPYGSVGSDCGGLNRNDNSEFEAEKKAFSSFCSTSPARIYRTASSPDKTVLNIIIEGDSISGPFRSMYNAGGFTNMVKNRSRMFKKEKTICATTSLRFVEGTHTYLRGSRRLSLCDESSSVEATPTARYQLRVGTPTSRATNPRASPYRDFWKVPVSIVDTVTQEVIAEDVLSFLGPTPQATEKCLDGGVQILNLISQVFRNDTDER